MKTRVIFVEGIPGAGKTSAVQRLAEILEERGITTKIFLEGDLDQPADYEGVAFVREDIEKVLIEKHKSSPLQLLSFREALENGSLIYYAKMKKSGLFSDEMIKEFSPYDVYEQPVEIFTALMEKKWGEFNKILSKSNEVYILDCCLLQNPTTYLSAKNNLHYEYIHSFILTLLQQIKDFKPLVVYIEPADINEAILHVKKERSTEWFDFLTDYYTKQEYGKYHCLSADLSGVVHYLTHRIQMEKNILSHSDVDWMHIQRNQDSWKHLNDSIAKAALHFFDGFIYGGAGGSN